MQIFAGTSGFAYKEWKGKFYPDDLPQKKFLAYYAERFGSVEVNATFYRMPRESTLVEWSNSVPPGFRFVLKMSRRITHRKTYDEEAEAADYFVRTSSVLGQNLGPTLVQLPPFAKKDTDRLGRLLDRFPRRWKIAIEFRHQSWIDDEVFDLLRERQVCLVHVDADDPHVQADLTPTTDWGYMRLRDRTYDDGELQAWVDRVEGHGWNEAFVFFKHEDEAAGPAMASRFMELAT